MPIDICDYCDPVAGLGDDAWAGESDRGSGGALVAVVSDGMGVQLSADGLGVTADQLVGVTADLLDGMP